MPTSTSRRVTVDREATAVADFVLDFTTSAVWDPHTVSCRSLDARRTDVGVHFENVQRIAGHEAVLQYEVTAYERGHRVVLSGGNDSIHTRDEIVVTSLPGGARVDYTVTASLLGRARVARPLLPVLLKKIADDGERGMEEVLLQRLPRRRSDS